MDPPNFSASPALKTHTVHAHVPLLASATRHLKLLLIFMHFFFPEPPSFSLRCVLPSMTDGRCEQLRVTGSVT